MAKLTQEEAIKRMREKNPEYDFSKFVYTRCIDKSIVICSKHGEFEKSYNDIKRGSGCPVYSTLCGNPNRKYTDIEFINLCKKMNPNVDLSKILYYKNQYAEYEVILSCGHTQVVSVDELVSGSLKCETCQKIFNKKIEKTLYSNRRENPQAYYNFKIKMWLNKYRYENHLNDSLDFKTVKYVNDITPFMVRCYYHGYVEVLPNDFFKSKYGCPKCEATFLSMSAKDKRNEGNEYGSFNARALLRYEGINHKVKNSVIKQEKVIYNEEQKLQYKRNWIEEVKIKFPMYDYSKSLKTWKNNSFNIICPYGGERNEIRYFFKNCGCSCSICKQKRKEEQSKLFLNDVKKKFPQFDYNLTFFLRLEYAYSIPLS